MKVYLIKSKGDALVWDAAVVIAPSPEDAFAQMEIKTGYPWGMDSVTITEIIPATRGIVIVSYVQ